MPRSVNISAEKLFDKAYKVGHLYGFLPAHTVIKRYRNYKHTPIVARTLIDSTDHQQHLSALLRFYFERELHIRGESLFILHSTIDRETRLAIKVPQKSHEACFTLTIIGVADPYAEALLLSCVNHIFRELQVKDSHIRINSMGTRNDSKLYFSHLSKTLRKVKKQIQPACKELLDRSLLVEAHPLLHDESHIGVAECITPTLRLLSDTARTHFEQVIEYLEIHDLSYELASDLVELTPHGVHTVFEVCTDNAPLRARGGRYDTFPFYMYRRRTPVTSVRITVPEKVSGTYASTVQVERPKAFFFHAGKRARLRSLAILSKLCEMNIPVAHNLHHVRVCDQLDGDARTYPYTIIFGEEEADNNMICMRKSDTRASSMVPIDNGMLNAVRNFMKT